MASSSFGGTTHFNAVDEDCNVVSCTHTPGGPTGRRPNGQGDRPTESRRRVEAAELRHPEVREGAADKERTPRHHFEHDEVMIEGIGGPRSRSMGHPRGQVQSQRGQRRGPRAPGLGKALAELKRIPSLHRSSSSVSHRSAQSGLSYRLSHYSFWMFRIRNFKIRCWSDIGVL